MLDARPGTSLPKSKLLEEEGGDRMFPKLVLLLEAEDESRGKSCGPSPLKKRFRCIILICVNFSWSIDNGYCKRYKDVG